MCPVVFGLPEELCPRQSGSLALPAVAHWQDAVGVLVGCGQGEQATLIKSPSLLRPVSLSCDLYRCFIADLLAFAQGLRWVVWARSQHTAPNSAHHRETQGTHGHLEK